MTRVKERQSISAADDGIVRSWLHPQTSHKVVKKFCRLHKQKLKLSPKFNSVKSTTNTLISIFVLILFSEAEYVVTQRFD